MVPSVGKLGNMFFFVRNIGFHALLVAVVRFFRATNMFLNLFGNIFLLPRKANWKTSLET